MGTFREGRVVQVSVPPDIVHRSQPRVGDRWTDKDGDDWLCVLTDDGLRLQLCDGESAPPSRAAAREPHYVMGEYGPLTLNLRNEKMVLTRLVMGIR